MRTATLILFISLISFSQAADVTAVPTTQYARIKAARDYKRIHRDALAQIVDKQYDSAINTMNQYLAEHPNDHECLYTLAVAYTQKQDVTKAAEYVNQALKSGFDLNRFIAGPRNLLLPLTQAPQFRQLTQKHTSELLHGPTLGSVTDSSAKFWLRTASQLPVQIILSESKQMTSAIKSSIVKTKKDRDFTATVKVQDLKPDTLYHYQLIVNDKKIPTLFSFRTFPVPGAKSKFQVVFGGGAGYTPENERMWNTIATRNPLAFLLLGDNVYIDHPEKPEVQQYCYYRRQSRPEFRSLAAATPLFAIWDDHDFGANDCIGGPDIDNPKWKRAVWNLYRDNWNNPYYAGGEKQPGCWFDFSIGNVDFFMLDSRYYRTDPLKENPDMLGPVQKKWLLEKLKVSKAAFKIIASPVPFAFGTKPGLQKTAQGMAPGYLDTWEGFKDQREEIFSFIEKNKIDGVVLISADRHRSEARKIERPNHYPLYEFESSKLTNTHTHTLVPGAIFD
ncbi:MAG: alkaline phosphatase D family protein, partial [Planctomycetota bacterium]